MRQNYPHAVFISLLILLSLGVTVWFMSAKVIWLGDDLDYKYLMKGEIWQSWGWINSWHEFWQSQFTHYQHVNGRFVAHALVQLFNGILGQKAFAVCNALVYSLLAYLIARTGKVALSNYGGMLSAACLAVICFVTKMMPTCQIGYIWGMAINLLWLMSIFSVSKPSWGKVSIMFLTGVIVGNWQESVSIGVCAGLGIWWLNQFFHRQKTCDTFFDWRRSWMILGYFIGTATNCLSPSTMSRVETVTTTLSDQLAVASYSLTGVLLLIIIIIIVSIRHINRLTFSFYSKKGGIPDGILATAMLFLLIFNIIIGVYSNRQLFGANLFALILLLRALPNHSLGRLANLAVLIAVLAICGVNLKGMFEVRRQYEDISSLYMQSKDGIVEYDRVRIMTLGHPLNAKYYEDILGQFDNDLHHSLMKDFKHNKKGKAIKLRPTIHPDAEKVEEYASGHFYVTVKEPKKNEQNREIIIYGHYSLLGLINMPAEPRKLTLLKYSKRNKPYATAIVIPEYPLFKADSISLIKVQ